MRFRFLFLLLFQALFTNSQTLRLHSLQHELRWLSEAQFPPFVTNETMGRAILDTTGAMLAQKFQLAGYDIPSQVDYRVINMFGKPKIKAPGRSGTAVDYDASVLSFITRGTHNNYVLWQMKVEVRQNGKTVFARETEHLLLHYGADAPIQLQEMQRATDGGIQTENQEGTTAWFTQASFLQHFQKLFGELLELQPALAYRYTLGEGLDHAMILEANSEAWDLRKNSNLLGMGRPVMGPYTTVRAEKLDTANIYTETKLGKETSVVIDDVGRHNQVIFDQRMILDQSKTKFYQLDLASGPDTAQAIFAVEIVKRKARSTFLSWIVGDVLAAVLNQQDADPGTQVIDNRRDISGRIITDSLVWDFAVDRYEQTGDILQAALARGGEVFVLVYQRGMGFQREAILKNAAGEHVANLSLDFSSAVLRIRRDITGNTRHAIATFYAVLLGAKNIIN